MKLKFWNCLLVLIGALICSFCVRIVANPFTQARRVVEKTIDADNVITNYEWFKQRFEDISAIDRKIELADQALVNFSQSAGDRQAWHRDDREEHARLSTVLLGLQQRRSDLVSEYNARSRMVNRAVFKTGDTQLPERISL